MKPFRLLEVIAIGAIQLLAAAALFLYALVTVIPELFKHRKDDGVHFYKGPRFRRHYF